MTPTDTWARAATTRALLCRESFSPCAEGAAACDGCAGFFLMGTRMPPGTATGPCFAVVDPAARAAGAPFAFCLSMEPEMVAVPLAREERGPLACNRAFTFWTRV